MSDYSDVPVVLAIGGNDPSGGAGLQADIQAIGSMGAHPAPVVTAITVQNTTDVMGFGPLDAELLLEQASAVLEDMPVTAIKVGMLGSAENAFALAELLEEYPEIPVVLDPVLAAGGGTPLADIALQEAIMDVLLPHVTLLTPNSQEARILVPDTESLDECAAALMEAGAHHVLITGTHEDTGPVHNRLYSPRRAVETITLSRLPGEFHGSGCTLASAVAALIARGLPMSDAVNQGLHYTWNSLRYAHRLGSGQLIPDRLFTDAPLSSSERHELH